MASSLFTIAEEPRIPIRGSHEEVEDYLDRLVEALIEIHRETAMQLNNNASGIVDTFADLPAAAQSEGRIYYIRTAGGGPPTGNWWGSDGSTWVLLG